MNISQLLFLALLTAMIFYLSRLRNLITDRIILFILVCSGVLLIIFPNISVTIANFVGIGRGTDLILYLYIFLSLFMFIYILSELNKIIVKLTNFVRYDAIKNSKDFSKNENKAENNE
jgi:hypothetical protein